MMNYANLSRKGRNVLNIPKFLSLEKAPNLFFAPSLVFKAIIFCSFFISLSCSWAAVPEYVTKAADLIQAEKYSEAYEEIQVQLKTHSEDVLLLRLKAVCLIETGYHDAAVLVLDQALSLDPENVACRYYMAQALAYRGSIVESIEFIQSILELAPESEYAKMAEGVLPELESLVVTTSAVSDSRRWSIYASLGAEYDDNVPSRPNESEDDSPTDSWKLNYSLYGEVRFPDQNIDDFPLTIGLSYSLSGSEFEQESYESYELFSQSGGVFVDYNGTVFDKNYSVRLEGNYSATQFGWEQYSQSAGLEGSLAYYWHEAIITTYVMSWENVDVEDDTEYPEYYSRDGHNYSMGLKNSFYFFDNKIIVGLNYLYRFPDLEGSQVEYRSHDISTSLTASLPWDVKFSTSLGYQETTYKDFSPDPPGRLEDVWNWSSSLERRIWDDTVFLELTYSYTKAQSSQEDSDYRNNVFGIALKMVL